MKITAVTYNIHKGFGVGKMRFLLPEMRTALQELAPDFVFLQEVQGEHKRQQKRMRPWAESTQFEFLAGESWPYYLYSKNAVYTAGHHGNAILSRYPFVEFANVNLSNMPRASRSILHAKVRIGQGKNLQALHLFCVHFGLFRIEQWEQCQALIQRIQEFVPKEEPLIMAGDFNDWRNQMSEVFAEALQVKEAFLALQGEHARSFPALRPALCVDRIYYRGMEIDSVSCLQGKPWRTLSDHLPLFAAFEQNDPPLSSLNMSPK